MTLKEKERQALVKAAKDGSSLHIELLKKESHEALVARVLHLEALAERLMAQDIGIDALAVVFDELYNHTKGIDPEQKSNVEITVHDMLDYAVTEMLEDADS